MIGLTFIVDDIFTIYQVYDQIQVIKYYVDIIDKPETPVGDIPSLTNWSTISGTTSFPCPINLSVENNTYYTYDPVGTDLSWYSSRYYDTSTGAYSGWSEPVLGEYGDVYYNPAYPPETELTDEEKSIIKRIRIYIGDPLGIRRDFGEEALKNVHPDGKIYELSEKGWPIFINMSGVNFNSLDSPVVNGYRYLKFDQKISDVCISDETNTNLCGDDVTERVRKSVDIWYYTFRNSDKQILNAYDTCLPPPGISEDTATTQIYILQTSIDLIRKELLEDATEDGAMVKDEGSVYDPEGGQKVRKDILDDLEKELKSVVKTLMFRGISGVLID
jgi:hypothetical protein